MWFSSNIDAAFKEPMPGEGANNMPKHIKETILFSEMYWSQLKWLELETVNFEEEFLSPLRIDKK